MKRLRWRSILQRVERRRIVGLWYGVEDGYLRLELDHGSTLVVAASWEGCHVVVDPGVPATRKGRPTKEPPLFIVSPSPILLPGEPQEDGRARPDAVDARSRPVSFRFAGPGMHCLPPPALLQEALKIKREVVECLNGGRCVEASRSLRLRLSCWSLGFVASFIGDTIYMRHTMGSSVATTP